MLPKRASDLAELADAAVLGSTQLLGRGAETHVVGDHVAEDVGFFLGPRAWGVGLGHDGTRMASASAMIP